jgi:hypothetical protein
MNIKEIYSQVATDLDLPIEVVEKSYKTFWLYIRNNIQQMSLYNIKTKEDFEKYKISFNIPSLGKLYNKNNIKLRKLKDA